jgi:hypothetical protein
LTAIHQLRNVARDIADGATSLDQIRHMRAILDDASYIQDLERELRTINDPEVVKELHRLATASMRAMQDRSVDCVYDSQMVVQIGAAGGIGFGVAAGASVFTGGASILVPVLAAIAVATIAFAGGRRLNKEAAIVKQLAERLETVADAVAAEVKRKSSE